MKLRIFSLVIISAFLLSSCASMSKRTKCICVGAAAGAAAGAATGAVIGHQGDTSNKLGGSLIGAAAGALVGGVTGYLTCKEEPVPPPPPPPPPKPEAKPAVVEKIVLNSIQFDFDSAKIKPEFYPVLDESIRALQTHSANKVIIEGHTCSIGTHEYNMQLSERRATAVKNYLVQKGITDARLSIEVFGPDKPVADNKSKQGRQMNRRVEFQVLGK